MSKIATYMEDFNLIGNFPLQAYTIFFFFFNLSNAARNHQWPEKWDLKTEQVTLGWGLII